MIHFSVKELDSDAGPSHLAPVYLKERREKSLSNIGIVNLYANKAEQQSCQSSRSCFFFFLRILLLTLVSGAPPALHLVRLFTPPHPSSCAAAADTQTGLLEGRRADVYEPLAGEAGRH